MDIFQRIESFGQAKLARALNIKPPTVNAWVSKKRPIPPDRAEEIAALLGCTADEVSERYREGALRAEKFKRLLPVFETKTDLDPPEDGELDAEVLEIELGASEVGTVAPSFLETRYRHTFSVLDWRTTAEQHNQKAEHNLHETSP